MTAPPLGRVLETALYVENMARAVAFFADVLGLSSMLASDRLTALDAGSASVLLLFASGASVDDVATTGGVIPGHDGSGRAHMAFAIADDRYEAWRDHLIQSGIGISSEVKWPAGGRSLYFSDPDGHVLELATPGLWRNY